MERKHTTHIAILVVALLAVTVSIYSSDSHAIQDVSRKAYFIPILLAAFWYGLQGGVITALTVCMLYIPHVILFWEDGLTHNPDRISEIALYNIVGLITGLMMQKQMAIQEQYKRASEELEGSYQQLKEQTELRIQAEEHLRKVDRMATLGELAAHMAHEIGNPLGSIKGAAEILCDDYTEGSDKYEFAQILIQETQRLNSAIQDFLGFGKPKALELVESDLNQLIQTAIQFITPQCAQQAISVELLLDDTLDSILMDPRKMEQAILNILFNAIAAMPEGGTLTLSTDAIDIDGNFSISAGTFDANSLDMNVAGNWTNSANFVSGTNTVTFDGAGTQTLISGGTGTEQDFNNLTHSGTGSLTLLANAIDIDGNFTNSAGTFSTGGQDMTVTGTVDNNANFRLIGNETLALTMDVASGTIVYYGDGTYTAAAGGLLLGDSYTNLVIDSAAGTGTYQLDAALDVNNSVDINSGTLDEIGRASCRERV